MLTHVIQKYINYRNMILSLIERKRKQIIDPKSKIGEEETIRSSQNLKIKNMKIFFWMRINHKTLNYFLLYPLTLKGFKYKIN